MWEVNNQMPLQQPLLDLELWNVPNAVYVMCDEEYQRQYQSALIGGVRREMRLLVCRK